MSSASSIGVFLAINILLAPFEAEAQQPKKAARIGYLLLVPLTEKPSRERQAFLDGLRDLGYVEGQNVRIEYRSASWNIELLSDLAAELADLKVDVIVAVGPQAALAAKDATKTIPIVMTAAADPVQGGLVASLARPGGNITGLTLNLPELGGKRLQLLKEAVQKMSPVAVLWNPGNPATVPEWKETQRAARALDVTLRPIEVRSADDFVSAFALMSKRRPASLMTIVDTLTAPYRDIIAEFALKNRLPTIASREFAEAGGLLSYGPSFPDIFRRSAIFIDKILRGANPADLPVEQPIKFELVINLKTAKALGLTIPQSLLLRADHVIQ